MQGLPLPFHDTAFRLEAKEAETRQIAGCRRPGGRSRGCHPPDWRRVVVIL